MLFLNKEDSAKYLHSFCPQKMWAGLECTELIFAQEDFSCCIEYEDQDGQYYYLAKSITNWLMPFSTSILIATEYGIWPSRENLHLFQRVRSSYSETTPIYMTPGHVFTGLESSDLITFLHLYMLFGWGGVISTDGSKSGFFSHDGWFGLLGEGCEMVAHDWYYG